jgi:hypothetical protein
MKRQLLGIAAFSIVLNSAAVSAANPDQIRQLQKNQQSPPLLRVGCSVAPFKGRPYSSLP